jgi:hypothetical protein
VPQAQDLFEIAQAMADMETTHLAPYGLVVAHDLIPDRVSDEESPRLPCTLRYPTKGNYSFGTISGYPSGTAEAAPLLEGEHYFEVVVLVGKASDKKSLLMKECTKWVGIIPKVYAAHQTLGGAVDWARVTVYELTTIDIGGEVYMGPAFVVHISNTEDVITGD